MSINIIGARSHAFRILAVFLAAFLTVGFASAANAVGQNNGNNGQSNNGQNNNGQGNANGPACNSGQGTANNGNGNGNTGAPCTDGGGDSGDGGEIVDTDTDTDLTGGGGIGTGTGGGGSSDGDNLSGDDENSGAKPGEPDGDEPVAGGPRQDSSGSDSSEPDVSGAEAHSTGQAGNSVLAEIKDASAQGGVNRAGAMILPAGGVLPATGAADNLGLLAAAGLALMLIGGLTISTRRRSVIKQR